MPWTQPAGWVLYWLTLQSGSGRCNRIQIWLSGFQLQLRPRSRLLVFPTKPGSAQSPLRWVWAACPEPGVRGAEWQDGESAPQQSLAEFSRAHWLQVGASLPGCAPGRALVPLQINSPRAVGKERGSCAGWSPAQ